MLVLVVPGVIILDQVSKALALRHLRPGVSFHLIDGVLALRLGLNTGLAFGLLAGLDESWRWVVSVVSIGALIVLARVASRILPTGGWLARIGLGLVFGGAVGNLIDRARFGAVVDFVDVYWQAYHWPAFNTADSAITLGVVLLAATLIREQAATSTSR